MVSHDERLREHPLQLAHERQEARLLFQRTRVLGKAPAVQSALVADAYAVAVVVAAVRPHLFQRSSAVDVTVAGDVEVIADVLESPVADVILPALLETKAPPLRGGGAMDDDQRHGSHTCTHDEMPNTPARAVATATIALRTNPHTVLGLLLVVVIIN